MIASNIKSFITLLLPFSITLSLAAKEVSNKNNVVTDLKIRDFSVERLNMEKELSLVDSLLSSMTADYLDGMVIEEDEAGNIIEIYDDLWDNDMVHPYKNAAIPDSVIIDCSKFIFPTFGHVTSRFGMRRRRMHNGIDLKVYKGDTISAAFDGKVRVAKYMRGYGNVIVLRHNNGLETIYGHLSKIKVKVDQDVVAGHCIGLGGNTGRSTGSHLHFETRLLGRPLNPSEMFDFDTNQLKTERYTFYAKKSPYRDPRYANLAYHKVKANETLGVISSKYKISISELCRINKLRTTSTLRIGQIIRLESNPQIASSTPLRTREQLTKAAKATANRQNTSVVARPTPTGDQHLIKRGESLNSIAKQYGISVSQLCAYNGITEKTTIKAGNKIFVSNKKAPDAKSAAKTLATPIQQTTQLIAQAATVSSKSAIHHVKSGDTLGKIAQKYETSVEKLCQLNGITRKTVLRPGQKLKCS